MKGRLQRPVQSRSAPMLHLKEPTSTHWLQALSIQLNFIPCQKAPQVLSCKQGLVSIHNCWSISPCNPRIHNSISTQCLRWGNQITKRLQLRQLVIINHYNKSQRVSNRSKVFQFLVTCNLKGVPHNKGAQQFHMYWNLDCAIIRSTKHDKGSIQMSWLSQFWKISKINSYKGMNLYDQ